MKRILMPILLVFILLVSCKAKEQQMTAQEYLNLGEKYLLELNYEQAIVMFTRVIEIEPKNERAYLGAAEAHIGMGNEDKALELLRLGLEATESESINAMLITLTEQATEQETEVEPVAEIKNAEESGGDTQSEPEPLTIADFENWIYPPGTTIWDVQSEYEMDIEEINSILSTGYFGYGGAAGIRKKEGYALAVRPDGTLRGFLFTQETYTYNGSGAGIATGLDESRYFEFPRGIVSGMHIKDVLNKFPIHNEEVRLILDSHENTYDALSKLSAGRHMLYEMADTNDEGLSYRGALGRGSEPESGIGLRFTVVILPDDGTGENDYELRFNFLNHRLIGGSVFYPRW